MKCTIHPTLARELKWQHADADKSVTAIDANPTNQKRQNVPTATLATSTSGGHIQIWPKGDRAHTAKHENGIMRDEITIDNLFGSCKARMMNK